jgi:hypothetical protein
VNPSGSASIYRMQSNLVGTSVQVFRSQVKSLPGVLWESAGLDLHSWTRIVPGVRLVARLVRLGFRSLETCYHLARGRTVILDRFIHDALLVTELDWPHAFPAQLVRHIGTEPELLLILDAPALLTYARQRRAGR